MIATESQTVVTYPIVAALVAAEEMPGMGAHRLWSPKNRMQSRFLDEFFRRNRDEIGRLPEIESLASKSADEINAFLRKKGFRIQLDRFDPNEFGVASVLDLLVEWEAKGSETQIVTADDTPYPAVRMDKGHIIYRVAKHRHPVIMIKTKSGDMVHLSIVDDPPKDFDLISLADRLLEPDDIDDEHEGVIFPMVDLNQEVDISWLRGLNTKGVDGRPAIVSQAKQQTKLRMNEVGARAESAAAIGIMRLGASKPKTVYIIDKPFLVCFTRHGFSKPLFVGHIGHDDWKKPSGLA